ncbi:hypothetical protein P12x_005326 [Tundrisphaera lichenicola]|uniref:hypothetical protein n=1 Tax=Tundrisphaera lichenicola TaxID=2029860 RepID=UPI003EC147DA
MTELNTKPLDVRRILEDCIDSLEYVNKAHPEVTGSGVRRERVAKAREFLAALEKHPAGGGSTLKRRSERRCKGCQCSISHKHVNARFCTAQCKDAYWNAINPRGYGLDPAFRNEDEFGNPTFIGVTDFDNTSCQNEE